MKKHISTEKSLCYTYDDYLTQELADTLFAFCMENVKFHVNPKIKIYGRECEQKRSIAFLSNVSTGYAYSGQIQSSQELPQLLEQLMTEVNTSLNTDFNGILVNLYTDGNDSIGFHSDSEKDLAKDGTVACISLGANRCFRIKSKHKNYKKSYDIGTGHGQLLVMTGNFQKEFTHGIPVQKSVTKPRISLTFRKHLT